MIGKAGTACCYILSISGKVWVGSGEERMGSVWLHLQVGCYKSMTADTAAAAAAAAAADPAAADTAAVSVTAVPGGS